MFPIVKPVRIRTTPILPLVYEDSLSYMEVLYKLLHKTNECIETLNDVSTVVSNHETRITTLETYIGELDGKLNAFKDYVQNQIDTFEAQVNEDFANLEDHFNTEFANLEAELRRELDSTISMVNTVVAGLERQFEGKFNEMSDELIAKVNRAINEMESDLLSFQREIRANLDTIDVRIDMLYNYINDVLADIAEHLPTVYYVTSPFTGRTITVQQAIDELYENGSRARACTCKEFESLGLTCSEFDAMELTAYEFDMFGLDKLPFIDDRFYMYSPFNGQYTTIKEVVIGLASLHQLDSDVYNCSEFDALELEASYFDGLEVTAYNFDWHSKNYVTAA